MRISKSRIVLYISILLIIAGIYGIVPSLYYRIKLNQAVALMRPMIPAAPIVNVPDVVQDKPVRLIIPSLQINLPIADGIYNPATREWTLSQDKVHFAVMTQMPNNYTGNTFIYGHNAKGLLNVMAKIPDGSEALIETSNGYTFRYIYRTNKTIEPTDTAIFSYSGAPILTIQTCAGRWFENRQLFTFDYVEVKGGPVKTALAH